LLEPDAGKLARPVLRGAERRKALGLPAASATHRRLARGSTPVVVLVAISRSRVSAVPTPAFLLARVFVAHVAGVAESVRQRSPW